MLWLIVLILILQASFHWILKPLIIVGTQFVEIRGFWIVFLFLGVWLISGRRVDGDQT